MFCDRSAREYLPTCPKTHVTDDIEVAIDAEVVVADSARLTRGRSGAIDHLVRSGNDLVRRGEVKRIVPSLVSTNGAPPCNRFRNRGSNGKASKGRSNSERLHVDVFVEKR